MIFNVSNGWLLNKIKYGINNHDEYILETLEAAKMLNVSVIELKDAILMKHDRLLFANMQEFKLFLTIGFSRVPLHSNTNRSGMLCQ